MYALYHFLFRQLAKITPAFGSIGAFCAIAMWRFDSTVAAVALVLCLILLFAARTWMSMGNSGPKPVTDTSKNTPRSFR